MFERRSDRRDRAEIHVYTARRLSDMAGSLEELARSFDEEPVPGRTLSREDGLAAMQAAGALVCQGCRRCSLYADSERDDSYYLYYLLRVFEQKGRLDREDMPRLFQESCRKQEDYIGQLNRNLGRATMNLSWKNRFLESRDAVISQFRELAVILEEFSRQLEATRDRTDRYERQVRREFEKHHMEMDSMLVLEYENRRKEAFLTVKTTGGRCVMTKDAAQYLQDAAGGVWTAARDSRAVITRRMSTVRFVEESAYRMVCGAAARPKEGEPVSGDSYGLCEPAPGQAMISLSDGMGAGETAREESRRVVEMAEQLLGAGYLPRSAFKLINTVLLLTGDEQHPATLDLCCVDLYTGVLDTMKMGAAATFVKGEHGTEVLAAAQTPAGVLNPAEPVLLTRKLWEEDRVVMVSDGVLDALPETDKEEVMREYLDGMEETNPQEMAERILEFAASFPDSGRDDMTVLVMGIWKR